MKASKNEQQIDLVNNNSEFSLLKPVVCVVGPTASGKTLLAQTIAQSFDSAVVSADSMQIYRGMNIGTGKLPRAEQCVTHYGIDLVNPGQPYSAALFQQYARACFCKIDARGKQAVLCGGTGFYVRAAIDAYEFPQGEQQGNALRKRYDGIAQEQGAHALWSLLNQRDADSAALVAPADTKRVIRALELLENGMSYAAQRAKLASLPQLVPAIFIGLAVDPATLNKKIDVRVDAMLEAGLVEEVEGLLYKGFRNGLTAPQAIGYKEIVAALDGEITLKEAVSRIKTATHRYAKRQRTWFRKDKRIHWLCGDGVSLDQLVCAAHKVIVEQEHYIAH